MTNKIKIKIRCAIENHEKFAKAYFWNPPSSASSRRSMEKQNTWSVQFKHAGHTYVYESKLDCSCKNVYYRGGFFLDGVQKNVRLFKNLLIKKTK